MSLKVSINNEVVLMRKVVRKAKVHLIHKFTKEIKTLRQKKGTPEQLEKNKKKADRLVKEIFILKRHKDDEISKYILTEVKSPTEILNSNNSTIQDRAFAKMLAHKDITEYVKNIKAKYLVPLKKFLTETKTSKIPKNSKKKPKKVKKKQSLDSTFTSNDLNENVNHCESDNIEEEDELLESKVEGSNSLESESDGYNSLESETENVTLVEAKRTLFNIVDMEKIIQQKTKTKLQKPETIRDANLFSIAVEDKPKMKRKSDSFIKVKSKVPKINCENELAEIKPFFEVIKKTVTDKSHIDGIDAKVDLIEPKGVDPFFISDEQKNQFLNIVIDTKSSDVEKRVNKVYNDNLNRKQRRMLKSTGKLPKQKRNYDSKLKFKDKNSFNKMSFNTEITTHGIPKNKHLISDVRVNKSNELENLHPSWKAKKLQKPQIIQFQGKKITFDE